MARPRQTTEAKPAALHSAGTVAHSPRRPPPTASSADSAPQVLAALEQRGLKPDEDTFEQLNAVFTYFPPPMS